MGYTVEADTSGDFFAFTVIFDGRALATYDNQQEAWAHVGLAIEHDAGIEAGAA